MFFRTGSTGPTSSFSREVYLLTWSFLFFLFFNFAAEYFYWVVEKWKGVILTIYS